MPFPGSLSPYSEHKNTGGSTEIGVTICGTLAQPQVNGRIEIKAATFNLADIPVDVYRTNGVILFDGDRATIQSFSGESDGGGLVRGRIFDVAHGGPRGGVG
jgi:autotransporter translocation and assembly factor TamB